MVRPLNTGGGETGPIYAPIYLVCFALTLSSCAEHAAEFSASAPPPPAYITATPQRLAAAVPPLAAAFQATAAPAPGASMMSFSGRTGGLSSGFSIAFKPALALDQKSNGKPCGFRDRFDRRATLIYNFDTNHQVAFKLAISNHSGALSMNHAFFEFHYRFNGIKSRMEPEPAEKCRYASQWQGLAGSVTNELLFRDINSIWNQAQERGLDFWH